MDAGSFLQEAFRIADETKNVTIGAVCGLVSGYLLKQWRMRKAYQSLLTGNYSGNVATLSETQYIPVPLVEILGFPVYDQRVRNFDEIMLDEIFHPSVRRVMIKYIEEAAKRCDENNPIVFSHLQDVVPERYFDSLQSQLRSNWITFWSKRFTSTENTVGRPQAHRINQPEHAVLPVLVYEKAAIKRQFRVMFFDSTSLEATRLALAGPEQAIRYHIGRTTYQHLVGHHHGTRVHTNAAILALFEDPDMAWIVEDLQVSVSMIVPEAPRPPVL